MWTFEFFKSEINMVFLRNVVLDLLISSNCYKYFIVYILEFNAKNAAFFLQKLSEMKCYAVVKLLKYSNIYSMQSFCFLLGRKVSYTTAVQFCAMFLKLAYDLQFFVVLNFNK